MVIGHAHCLQLLTRESGESFENDGFHEVQLGLLPQWKNCEWRTFVVEEDEDKVLLFNESKGSRKARAKEENVPCLNATGKHAEGMSLMPAKGSSESSISKRSLKRSSTASSQVASSTDRKGSLKEARKVCTYISSSALLFTYFRQILAIVGL